MTDEANSMVSAMRDYCLDNGYEFRCFKVADGRGGVALHKTGDPIDVYDVRADFLEMGLYVTSTVEKSRRLDGEEEFEHEVTLRFIVLS